MVASRPCVGLLQVFAAVCFNSSNKKMILVILLYHKYARQLFMNVSQPGERSQDLFPSEPVLQEVAAEAESM